MRKLISIFSLVVVVNCSSQGYIAYYNKCNDAFELIEKAEYNSAKELLLSAIQSVKEPLAVDLFNLSKCYSQLNQRDSTLFYLELSLKMDFRVKKACIIHRPWFEPILGAEKWNKIKNTDYYEPVKLNKREKELIRQVNELASIGQHFRKIVIDSIEVYHLLDTMLISLYWDSVRINDLIVSGELDQLINKNGWPCINPNYEIAYAELLLIHASDQWFNKMSSILIQEIDKGNLNPHSYATIADRIQLRNNLPPLYNGYAAENNQYTEEIIRNCKIIGVPIGKQTREIRRIYKFD